MAQFFFTAVFSIAFLNSTLGAVDDDKLFPHQSLVPGKTLVSRNQDFEMGFFSPGKSSNRYLGVWYKRVLLFNNQEPSDSNMEDLFFTTILCSLLLHSAASLSLTVGSVEYHKLFPNQTLVVGKTLVSQNQDFEMGFFSPGKSSNRYLGIWYKSTPDVVAWVANRNDPTSASQAPVFTISGNGTLVISDGESVIWLANSSMAATNPVLHLLDSGNLVIVDNNKEGYLWESFDYPTDTSVAGMKLVDDMDAGVERYLTSWRNSDDPSPGEYVIKIQNHNGLAEILVLRGGEKKYRHGQWNGKYFWGGVNFPNSVFDPELVFREERLISVEQPYKSSNLERSTIDSSGAVVHHRMNDRKDKWNVVTQYPLDTCDEYASCGPNSMCISYRIIRCWCFRGFSPRFQKDWGLQDFSGGCARITPLNCHEGDGFLQIRGVKYPDMLSFRLNTSMSLSECREECLKNCSCTAYANPFITNGGSGCLMWFGELIDTKELSDEHSKENFYIRVPLSELDFKMGSEEDKEEKRPTKSILISIASGVLISAIINGILLLAARQKGQVRRNDEDIELPVIKMATIVQATNDFSQENMIGVGGFGPVYKGKMPSGEEIAVKRLSRSSQQGLEEFRNEVMVIAKLQHRNLVRLLGCCVEKEERMLIYEYLENKSLDCFIFDPTRRTLLTWPKRYEIIMGIVRGLLYLHHDSRLKIIHRDLKTSNILLDINLNPKISDFGLARSFEEGQSLARTKRVIGTYGYMAPEYAIDGKFSVKSDIFSLGVVMLEIISGKKNRGYGDSDCYLNLLGDAWMLWKENKILKLMDECLNDTFMESQVKRCMQVGLLCVQKFAEDRPTMASVVSMLGSDGAFLPEPKEPGFFVGRSCCNVRSSSESDNATITITDLEAR